MNDFVLVLVIASVAALQTFLGAPAAERFDIPHQVLSAALQFAAGIIPALVALSLMPPVARYGPLPFVVLAFFIGGALFVWVEYYAGNARRKTTRRSNGRQVRSAFTLACCSI